MALRRTAVAKSLSTEQELNALLLAVRPFARIAEQMLRGGLAAVSEAQCERLLGVLARLDDNR